ncbi:EamA family transporter [Geovibrio thiophilus]|uniref:EamA family transporter n=1 Tax=Geovibrio thiophilus TaxID=139438 RepID=A0A410K0P2_9BACT|nr:DMT family transporter [Geovibrio thiophilus]QAR33943.1 EamA family transporter [Geovibrio thiophilus]
MTGFIFIVFSALCHSLWNVLLKRSSDKYAFNFFMHLVNLIFFTALFPVFFREYMYFDKGAVIYGLIGGTFFALYHLFISTAYRYSDVSSIYPITTSSPFFILIWATLFLGERLTFFGVSGIIFTVLGGIVLNGEKGSRIKPAKGTVFALLAAFSYSFGALADKGGVGGGNMIFYTYCLCFFMTSYLAVYSLRHRPFRKEFIMAEKKYFIIAGVIVFLSFTSYRYGLTFMEVSYAAALRQVNAVFALIIGVFVFKEAFSLSKLTGTLIIVIGIVLIRFGM